MAASLPSKVLIIGATGTIGKYITNAILSASPPVAQQVSIFTSPSTASNTAKQELLDGWKAKGVSVITGDINNTQDVTRAYGGIDTVVSALGRNSLISQIELLRLAEEGGNIQWFLPSEYGTDIEYDETSPPEKPHQNKLKVRAFVRDNIKRLKVTYVVTGPYIDMFLRPIAGGEAAGGWDAKAGKAIVVETGDGKVGLTSMPDVGKFVAETLRHPEVAYGKALKVQSFVTTPNAITAEFEKQTGRKWTVEQTPLEKVRQLETEAWDAGKPFATGITLRRIWAEGRTLYEKTDNEDLGVKTEDLEPLSVVVARAVSGEGW